MMENGAHFFEGTEKLLEVWFARQQPSPQEPHQSKGSGDLRTIPRLAACDRRWEGALRQAIQEGRLVGKSRGATGRTAWMYEGRGAICPTGGAHALAGGRARCRHR